MAVLMVLALAFATGSANIIDLPCTDISDPWACVAHTDLSLHICEWCAAPGSRGCRPVGLNNCSAPCCVAKGSLSSCDMDDVKDLAAASSCDGSTATARSAAALPKPKAKAVGVGFSGGGSRAFTYLYAPTNASDDALVGAYVPPENLTVAAVTSAAGSFAELPAAIITKCVELLAERALYDSKPWDHIWRDAIYQTFLKPTGIGVDQPFFATRAAADAAAARNAAVFGALSRAPLAPRDGAAPDVVFVGAIEGPEALIPLANNTYLPLAMGPEYVGTGSGVVDVPYAKHWPWSDNGTYGIGGYVESWAFGSAPVAAGDDGTAVALAKRLFSLNNAVGIASMAPAALLTHLPEVLEARRRLGGDDDDGDAGSGLLSLVPTFRLWAPAEGVDPDDPPDFFAVGDGGDLDNFGILHLLQRGLDRIVATADLVDLYIPAMFGRVVSADVECNVANNHVFDAEGLPRLVAALQAANATGSGAVASVNVTTVANELFGIEAGRVVDLTFVYLDLPRKWVDALPDETKAAIADDMPNFPQFPTITHLDLSVAEVSLLSQLNSWVVREHAALLAAKLR
ncbi:hypothetical protein SO694_00075157 [Aureococcus anophagefferens]|uniref:PNPLA domain-containing protein n=1 Tax=Aureococcus anophagefferens TaxID=44056 RepID=A0ABR1FHD1_AURAN